MAVPAALTSATLNAAVATLPTWDRTPYTEPPADLATAAANLAAALIATGLVDSGQLLVNGAVLAVPPHR